MKEHRVRDLLDDDVRLLSVAGIFLIALAIVPLTITTVSGDTWRLYVFVAGAVTTAGAEALRRRRRDKSTIKYRIMRFMQEKRAVPDSEGIPPTVIQRHFGLETSLFRGYIRELEKHFVQRNSDGKLVLTVDAIAVLMGEKTSWLFEGEAENET